MIHRPETLRWQTDRDGNGFGGHLVLLDQTRLPGEIIEIDCRTVEEVWQAIKRLAVRGAPAIGCAAAYGVCLAEAKLGAIEKACDYLAASRPTAVNLFWALDRMRETGKRAAKLPSQKLAEQLLAEAKTIHEEDRKMCAEIGRHGADLLAELPVGSGILTHCNAGALATGGDGTALSVIFELANRDRKPHVWVDEHAHCYKARG